MAYYNDTQNNYAIGAEGRLWADIPGDSGEGQLIINGQATAVYLNAFSGSHAFSTGDGFGPITAQASGLFGVFGGVALRQDDVVSGMLAEMWLERVGDLSNPLVQTTRVLPTFTLSGLTANYPYCTTLRVQAGDVFRLMVRFTGGNMHIRGIPQVNEAGQETHFSFIQIG